MEIKHQPFDIKSRRWVVYNILIILVIWFMGIFAYFNLPDLIPTHFDLKGNPDAFGKKTIFLILPIILSFAQIIILILVKYRFTLINKYPYLINLPGFFIYINKISNERKSYWLNRYFDLLLKVNFILSLYLLTVFIIIIYSTDQNYLNSTALIFILLFPFIMIILLFIILAKISNEMKAEANGNFN
ncbi:MAG: DUF1648 domain-containing protein [Ignavibacteria bacterium]|nr:DUF1648 domain-containing protein [Ignavibacteria bacterium]